MSDSLVIIPTYNEEENIGRMIETVFSLNKDFHILIIDDNSKDSTAKIVKELQANFPTALFMVERPGKMGLGTAYIRGFKWAIEKKYDYIFEMDADFSHNPKHLIRLYSACHHNNADVSVGSRYITNGRIKNWPLKRKLLSRGASLYVQLITRMGIKDSTAGFVCYKRKVLETIDLDKIKFIGYAFQIEMKYAATQLGFQISEVPITFIDRELGTSKMSMNIFNEAVFGVLQVAWGTPKDWYKKIE